MKINEEGSQMTEDVQGENDFRNNPEMRELVEAFLDEYGYSEDGEVAQRLWLNLFLVKRMGITDRPELVFAISAIDAEVSAGFFRYNFLLSARSFASVKPKPSQYLVGQMAKYLHGRFHSSLAERWSSFGRHLLHRPDPSGFVPYRTQKEYMQLLEDLWQKWQA